MDEAAGASTLALLLGLAVVLLAILILILLAVWPVVFLHERGHARVAERHTNGLVVVRVGAPVLGCVPLGISRRFGFERTRLLVGPFAFTGYCAHDPIEERDHLIELYDAGTVATGRAARWSLGLGVALALLSLVLPDAVVTECRVAAAAVLSLAVLFAGNWFLNRAMRIGPGKLGLDEGTDGYVLKRLRESSTYLPTEAKTGDELASEFESRIGCGNVGGNKGGSSPPPSEDDDASREAPAPTA